MKELDKFVGHEVSFYTFLTAVQNPKSVLYTEHVGNVPYNGINCAAYYGTVCSMSVNYALGLDYPFQSNMYSDLPFFEKVKQQDPYGAKIGDVLGRSGHVVLIEDIKYNNDGTISSVYILESLDSYTKIKRYSLDSFVKRWETSSWVLYRYLDFGRVIRQEEYPFLSSVSLDNYSVEYESAICAQRGDKSCYRQGEQVVINVLSPCSREFKLFRNGQVFSEGSFHDDEIVFNDLPYGLYEVRVENVGIEQSSFLK